MDTPVPDEKVMLLRISEELAKRPWIDVATFWRRFGEGRIDDAYDVVQDWLRTDGV